MSLLAGSPGRAALEASAAAAVPVGKSIQKVEAFPRVPGSVAPKDWKKTARDFDRLLFDFNAKGEYQPIIKWDLSGENGVGRTFFLPSYIGANNWETPGGQESVCILPILVGSTLAGIDKSNQPTNENGKVTNYNYVKMIQAFYQSPGFLFDTKKQQDGNSMWYDITPALNFSQLAQLYPDVDGMEDIMKSVCDLWYTAVYRYGEAPDKLDFLNSTGYSFFQGKPAFNGQWKEMDGGVALGMLMYYAYNRFGDQKYLKAALDCLYAYERTSLNPLYEALASYAPLLSARMNAELGTDFNTDKYLKWNFECDSDCRWGYIGVFTGKAGAYDAEGTYGAYDNGGYMFTYDTMALASNMAAVPKYDARYARSIGRYLLNAVVNASLHYPDALDKQHQSCPDYKGDPDACVPYEGFRSAYAGKTPYLMGDPTIHGWGHTDLGIYSGAMVGYFAALADKTDVDKIYRFNLDKLDFYGKNACPAYLYYNPHTSAKAVTVDIGSKKRDIYDSVTNAYIAKNVSGKVKVQIAADSAVVLKLLPAGQKLNKTADGRLFANGQFIGRLQPAVNILNLEHKQKVSDAFTLKAQVMLPAGESLRSVSVKMDGKEVYRGKTLPASLKIDTKSAPNGMSALGIYAETASGYKDYQELQLFVVNKGADLPLDYTGGDFVGMETYGTSSAAKDGANASLTSPQQSGGLLTKEFELDLSKNPYLYFNAPQMQYGFNIRILYSDGSNQYGDNVMLLGNNRTEFVSDINDDLTRHQPTRDGTGRHKVRLMLLTNGFNGSTTTLERVFILYPTSTVTMQPAPHGANSLTYKFPNAPPAGSNAGSAQSIASAGSSSAPQSAPGAQSGGSAAASGASEGAPGKSGDQGRPFKAWILAAIGIPLLLAAGGAGLWFRLKQRKAKTS